MRCKGSLKLKQVPRTLQREKRIAVMSKPKVFLSVLCQAERTGWINPFLYDALMTLQTDPRFSLTNVMAYGIDRVETVRNRAVQYARDEGADHLIMCDN